MAAAASDPAIVTLAPYIVAGMAIVGSAVTVVITQRQSHRAWLREARLRAYAELLQAAGDMWATARTISDAKGDREISAAEWADLTHKRSTTALARNLLWVLGPESVSEAASLFMDCIDDCAHEAERGTVAQETLTAANDAEGKLISAMRRHVSGM